MKRTKSAFKIYFLMAFVVMSLFFSATAYAASDNAKFEVVRLRGTYVGVKIALDSDISGNVMGLLAGKGFDCVVARSNFVYCIGPFRTDSGPATFFLIDKDTKEVILKKVLYPPKSSGFGEEEKIEQPTPPPAEELPSEGGPSDEGPIDELPSEEIPA